MMNIIQAHIERSQSFPIALVVSLFNRDITHALQVGAVDHLAALGVKATDITLVEVPGAVEIPLVLQKLAGKNKYGAMIALGAVIRGETSHYESVCQSVTEGCLRVSLDFDIPVILGVLMTENEAQAWDRLGGAHGHKGRDAVDTALAMHDILQKIAVRHQ